MNVAMGPETRVTQTFRGVVRLRLLEKPTYKPFWTEKQGNKHKSWINARENGHCYQLPHLSQRHRIVQCLSRLARLFTNAFTYRPSLVYNAERKTEWYDPGWKLTWGSFIDRGGGVLFNVDKNWDQKVMKFIPDVIFKLEKNFSPTYRITSIHVIFL